MRIWEKIERVTMASHCVRISWHKEILHHVRQGCVCPTVNTMAADVLVPQGTRTSAAIVLTLSLNILFSTLEWLKLPACSDMRSIYKSTRVLIEDHMGWLRAKRECREKYDTATIWCNWSLPWCFAPAKVTMIEIQKLSLIKIATGESVYTLLYYYYMLNICFLNTRI